jgi:hypothetical protein
MRSADATRTWCVALAAILASSIVAAPGLAYNPPVDAAGPLVVRIEGPDEVTDAAKPLPVRVVVGNRGTAPVEGTVELGVIDRWQAEPAGAVRFAVAASGTAERDFEVIVGQPTYNAHYPIHAFVRFRADGKDWTAHPILVVEARLPEPPRAVVPVEWTPFPVAESGRLALWRLPVHRSIVAVFGEQPSVMPVGWQGSEPRSHGSFGIRSETLAGNSRSVVAIHPPWYGGLVGTQLVEFPLVLPKTTPIRLDFANAVTPTGEGDGVTFRVRVAPLDAPEGAFGKVAFERHTDAKTWNAARADLSEFAGRAVRLQLESHPGPENNTGWDQSYWAEPELVVGTPAEPAAFPPASDEGSRRLGTAGAWEYRLWLGERGLLDGTIGFSRGAKRLWFHGFEASVLGGRIDDARSPVVLVEAREEPCDEGCQVRHRFRSSWGTFDLVGRLWVEHESLRAKFELQNAPEAKPWMAVYLEGMAAGSWSEPARQVYAGPGNVIREPGPFRLNFDGHRLSTSFVGFDFPGGISMLQAVDVPPNELDVRPADRHYSLHAAHTSTWTFVPADNVWEAVQHWRRTNGIEAAGGVHKAAGRFVFDLWGGRYGESADALRRAFRYGLTDAMVMWHNWQRWGYDYRLPDIYPPNPQLGTLDEMRDLIAACEQAGVPIALHDNYIDFYPDAEGFSYEENIAFHRDGTPVKAWLNEGRGARSYRYRADRIEPYLKRNLHLIREGLAPTSYFIDVWSSAPPYDYWTADGRFVDRLFTRSVWGGLFAWIRDLLGGDAPQISESGHDQLIGWLDGAQTNHLRVGPPVGEGRYRWAVWNWPCADAERTPWFDAAHHDRFILHGAGYSSRYQGGLDARLHGMYSDDYMTTEVLTGHPGMVSQPFGRDVVRKYWLLQDLMRALALRTIEGVEYVDGDLHRQHVRWSGGARVWVNRGEADWQVAGATLPQYGFLARVPTEGGLVEASISRHNGVIVEMARSADRLYVNGRRVVDPALPIEPRVDAFKDRGDRTIELTLEWQADVPIPEGYRAFLHFCDQQGEILFQASQDPSALAPGRQGTIGATATATVPGEVAVGETLELRAGMYAPSGGQRLALRGPDDGTRRIRLGTIRLEGEGDRLAAITWKPHVPEPDPLLARQNPEARPVDFGPIETAGACRLTRQGDALVITPLPDERAPGFTATLRWDQLPWKLPRPARVESLSETGESLGRSRLEFDGDAVAVECSPRAFAHRLTGD